MPGFNGTGPFGQGPLTGRGMGFCVVKFPDDSSPASREDVTQTGQETETFRETREEVIAMPAGDRTGPLGFGPMTGRAAGYCAGYPVPGFMNRIGAGWGPGFVPAYGMTPYGQPMAPYGYGMPYGGAPYAPIWGRPFGRFGRGFGRGWGRGFGRGWGRGRRWFGW
jgi:hypothetical protein